MVDYNNDDFNNLCVNDLCINEYEFEKTAVIRPPEKKNVKFAQRFIFVDTTDVTLIDGHSFIVDFGETIKDVVEIELMSCNLPEITYNKQYLLLFVDNLDIDNYKISTNTNVSNCFARLPIPGKSKNVFFGRIKNFTNSYTFKPTLQKISKLKIRITDKDGEALGDNFLKQSEPVQLTFGITYQIQPDLFD
tara:strand:- start:80 stop:652 length:573 start_codon:yes stop_codon:yes gene_type:complete